MPARFWLDLTTEEFRTRDMGRTVAVLPVAAVEQHGPHLPVGTDTAIAEGYLQRAMARVPDELDVLVLPVQTVGLSSEHGAFPGTLTLPAETLIRSWTEIGALVHRAGCRKIVLVTSHGGNVPVADLVARELRVAYGMVAVVTAWRRFGYPEGLYEPEELRHGIHAGAVETSLMLAFRPQTVRMEQARTFEPRTIAMERDFTHLRAAPPHGFAWMAQDLHPAGAMGNAAEATPEKGERSADHGAERFVELLREVDRFALEG